jgi:hypothetical protein
MNGVRLMKGEVAEGLKKVKGAAVDKAVRLSKLYHDEHAPKIVPIAPVEQFFRIELVGYPRDIVGRMDVQEAIDIRDTKTSTKKPNIDDIEGSDQATIYTLGYKLLHGRMPEKAIFDYLIDTKEPKALSFETTRDEKDIGKFFKRVERGLEVIEKGAYMPNPQGWACSARWCGFFEDICAFGRRAAVTVAMPGEKK